MEEAGQSVSCAYSSTVCFPNIATPSGSLDSVLPPSDLGGKCEKTRNSSCFYLQIKQGKQSWTLCQGVRPQSGPGAGGGQGVSANSEAPEACIGLCLLWAPPGRVALVHSDEGEAGPWGTGFPASLPPRGAQQESGGARL